MHGASAVFVVKNGNGTACIMANFSATFLTSYDTRSGPQVGEPGPPHPAVCARVLGLLDLLTRVRVPWGLGGLCSLRLQSHRPLWALLSRFHSGLFQLSS